MMLDAILRTLGPRVISRAAGVCLCLSYAPNTVAAVDVCRPPAEYSHLSVAYSRHADSSFAGGVGRTNQHNHNIDLLFRSGEGWAFGAGHHYDILGIEQLRTQSNGHVHTVFFPLHKTRNSGGRGFRVSIAPALAASSNVVKDPGEYSADAFQLLGALVWSRELSSGATLRYGVCGDQRFGSYALYPSISLEWQPHVDWTIELGFPTSRFVYRAADSLDASLLITPDGNEWHVSDKAMEKQSQLIYEASLIELAFRWTANEHIAISASVGRQFDNRYELTLVDDRRIRLSSDSVTRIGAALAWRF